MKINSMYFNKEQVAAGEMNDFISVLFKQCYTEQSDLYNDIHIHPEDLGAFIVEWVQTPWDHSYGGKFVYINEDQIIYTEYLLPDRSFIALPADQDFNDFLNNWLKENPGWKRTSYGTWTNEIENAKYRKEFGIDGE